MFREAFSRGARVRYHDPLMPIVNLAGELIASVELDPIDLGVMDAVVLLTPHTGIDYDRIIRAAPLVIDTHSGLTPREAPNVVNIWVPEALAATPALS